MSSRRLLIVSIAAISLSLSGYATLADPSTPGTVDTLKQSPVAGYSTFTLIRGHGGHGGHGGGGISSFSRGPGGPSVLMNRSLSRRSMTWDRDFRRGHRRHFRHRRFVGGVWVWDYDDGGSCYWNCIAAGYSRQYCSIYAYNFCY